MKRTTIPNQTPDAKSDRSASDLEALRTLYPHLTDEELLEAADNLEQYADLVMRISIRLEGAPGDGPVFDEGSPDRYDEDKGRPIRKRVIPTNET